jgi:hypothetical protein
MVHASELSVIDVGNGLNAEVRRSEYRYKQEHGHSVSYETSLDALPCVVDWIAQRADTLKKQNDNDP